MPERPSLARERAHAFSIAGLTLTFQSELEPPWVFDLPDTFDAFASGDRPADVRVSVGSCPTLLGEPGPPTFESGLNWRVHPGPVFEHYYPPTFRILSKLTSTRALAEFELVFDEEAWRNLGSRSRLALAYPLDQLLVLPQLAEHDGFLIHACGAVIDGKALVFAGHSGDGKTTLARMLAAEGIELLSDERVAIRKESSGFRVYGTPWCGEGNVVSTAAYPLGGIFLLKKAGVHRIRDGKAGALVAEFLSRSIVPYYFSSPTVRILALVQELAERVPIRELHFSLDSGLLTVLANAA